MLEKQGKLMHQEGECKQEDGLVDQGKIENRGGKMQAKVMECRTT